MAAMNRFHAHVYFASGDLERARFLVNRAGLMNLFELVKLHEQPIGPHPTAMIEVHFSEQFYIAALDWLEANRGVFSVLIHQDTGDDFKNHTDGIQWLGKRMPLDFNFFELIQIHPELEIHQRKTLTAT